VAAERGQERTPIRSFASSDRFLAELRSPQLRPGYVLAGDETFLYQRCRLGVLEALMPLDRRDFGLHDFDLGETSIFEVLDRAQTPSLMVPFQVIFVRGLKLLYARGSKKEEFAAIDAYFRRPNPQALILFVAEHLHIPTDLRRMDMQDKERFDRIRETLGEWCGMVELARVEEADAVRWLAESAAARNTKIDSDAARELVDALGADMMLIASEFEKLCLYVQGKQLLATPQTSALLSEAQQSNSVLLSEAQQNNSVILSEARSAESKDLRLPSSAPATMLPPPTITLGDVETMVLAAKQRSLYELTDAISAKDRPRALALLHGLLNASDGGEDSAIGHLYMLARTFRQMLIILEKNVRDSRAIWAVLWQGFRMPPFAAADLIRQARRYKSRADLTRALRLIARADLEIRSSPPDKRRVLERLVLALASEPKPHGAESFAQFAMEL
jgi:DNA polymerase-3 subunit delta